MSLRSGAGCRWSRWTGSPISSPRRTALSQPHLTARDTRLILMARAPQPEIAKLRDRMGWTIPWYSSFGSDFNNDMGLAGLVRTGQLKLTPSWRQHILTP